MMPLVRLLATVIWVVPPVGLNKRPIMPPPTDREIVPRFMNDVVELLTVSVVRPPSIVTVDGAVKFVAAATFSSPPASCSADVPKPVAFETMSLPACTVVMPL